MTRLQCDGVALGVEQAGSGTPLVLVHGGWTDRSTWDPVFPMLSGHFRAIRYDRRGYGESQRPGARLSQHAADLLALIRTLGLERVILVGNSFGAAVALRAALAQDGAISLVVAHEPPLFEMLEAEPRHSALAARIRAAVGGTLEAVRNRDYELAARRYVEGVTSCSGAWQYLPASLQQSFVENAPVFLDEAGNFGDFGLEASELRRCAERLVITRGGRSSPYLRFIAEALSAALPEARAHVFSGAGHVPHASCPDEFVARLLDFAAEASLRTTQGEG